MKKLFLILSLALVVGIVLQSCKEQGFRRDAISYDFTVDGVKVIANKVNPYVDERAIPESIVYQGKTYSVVEIADEAFADSKMLKKVTIPATVKRIGKDAFKGCEGLQEIHLQIAEPLTIDPATFDGVKKASTRLYVPIGRSSYYTQTATWKDFQIWEEGKIETPTPADVDPAD